MAKYAGSSFSVRLIDGHNLAPAIMENASMSRESITQQTNPFGVTGESHTPVGLVKGILVAGGGLYDAAVDTLHTAVATVIGVSRIVAAAIHGNTIGKPFMGFEGAIDTKYEVIDAKDGITKANVTYLVTGAVDDGVIVQHLLAYTADWDTKTGGAGATDAPVDYSVDPIQRQFTITGSTKANPCEVTTAKAHGLTTGQKVLISGNTLAVPDINSDLAVTVTGTTTFTVAIDTTASTGTGNDGTLIRTSSVAGGVGYLEVTAFTVATNTVVKIMHSPDDITYSALITFATITAANSKERKTVSGTVDRYLSSNGVLTGAGSITVFTGLSRN